MQTLKEPSREEVWKMFDEISSSYDVVNRVMTLGCDQFWRKKMACFLPKSSHLHIVDCATGTADQMIALMEKGASIEKITGVDLSEEMLKKAKEKLSSKSYASKVELRVASALALPFEDNSIDCVTISFGIRNVTDTMAALKEFRRVLKPHGKVLILEATTPSSPLLRLTHKYYMRYAMPWMGRWISSHRQAYRYLNQTVETFPQGERFNGKLRAVGFVDVDNHPLFGGIVTIYEGTKDVL